MISVLEILFYWMRCHRTTQQGIESHLAAWHPDVSATAGTSPLRHRSSIARLSGFPPTRGPAYNVPARCVHDATQVASKLENVARIHETVWSNTDAPAADKGEPRQFVACCGSASAISPASSIDWIFPPCTGLVPLPECMLVSRWVALAWQNVGACSVLRVQVETASCDTTGSGAGKLRFCEA